MFQKIIGVIGSLAVVGAIVMVAVTPRTEGFFPDMFERVKRPREVQPPAAPVPVLSEPDHLPLPPADTLPLLPEFPDEQAG